MKQVLQTKVASNVIDLATRQLYRSGGRNTDRASGGRTHVPLGDVGTMTPLNDAEGKLAKALARFERAGISLNPRIYLEKKYKPLSGKQRKAVASVATAVRKAAMAVAQIADDSAGATATRSGANHLFDRVQKTTTIWVLMGDIVRVVAATDNPEPVAFLISLAQYLAGITPSPGGGRPPDHLDEDQVADFLARQQTRRAA